MIRFDVMTLFPDLVEGVLGESIIGRAQKAGFVSVKAHNIRDFANNKHRKVDDTPYGGGFGMLMMAPPVYDCYEFVKDQVASELGEDIRSKVIYMSPQGKVLTQKKAQELADRASKAEAQREKKINYGGLPGTKPRKRK